MERRKIRLDYIAGLIFVFSCVLSAEGLDVTKIEKGMNKLEKSLNAIPDSGVRENYPKLRRDPFVPLASEKKIIQSREEKKEKVIPVVHVSGIVFDKRMPLAIIGTEVKKEGESLGEFQVYRIEEDRVLIKYGEDIFPFAVKKGES